MEILKVPGTTGDYHTDLNKKGLAAIRKLKESDKGLKYFYI